MARTIESPGVEIREVDLSLRVNTPVGTKVLLNGFASQGPTNELVQVSTQEELDQIFFGGAGPTNPAERYFYHSAKELLNSPATMYVTRLPYGSGGGTGFNGEYTALAYPLTASNGFYYTSGLDSSGVDVSGFNTNFSANYQTASTFSIGEPVVIPLTETQYLDIKSSQITWSLTGGTVTDYSTIGNAGMVIINDAKTTINEKYEGYYVVIADNSTMSDNILNGYSSIREVNTLKSSANTLSPIATSVLGFTLTGNTNNGNISEVVETSFNYDFSDVSFKDSLVVHLFRLRTSEYSDDKNKLYFAPVERYAGSLEEFDIRVDSLTKVAQSFYLPTKINNESSYMSMYVNDNISKYATVKELINDDANKALNPLGKYTPCKTTSDVSQYVGVIPTKLDTALALAENVLDIDIDIVLDSGLSTIWAYAEAADGDIKYDDTADVSALLTDLANPTTGGDSAFALAHRSVFNSLNNFCQNVRKDCMTIVDPIRGIFVNGKNSKVLDRKDKNFSQHVFTPLKNLFSASNSNYAATYANWIQVYDTNAKDYVWIPYSGYQAAIMARLDALQYPWSAPFGLNNGIIRNITNIAVKPNQKQMDSLYRIGINPVTFFNGDGFVCWGQKTLQTKPSAFDRINVRRLFVTLERATMKTLRYFVAEPNTVFTRTRVNNTLKPLFDLAKNNEGVYDYLIICSEKNNDAQTIDNNEMKVDIYLKPVRTAEFILCTFYATRTDANFSELAG